MAGQVEVVGRLVEHEAVHALRREAARTARVRSPGESVAAAHDVLGAEAELGQQRSRLASVRPVAAMNASSSVARRRSRAGAWSSSPTTHAGPSQRSPATSGRRPRSTSSSSVVLPAAVGADDRDALAPADLEVDRAERERAALAPPRRSSRITTSPLRAGDRRARSAGPSPPTASRPRRAVRSPARSRGLRRLLLRSSAHPEAAGRTCRSPTCRASSPATPCDRPLRCVRARSSRRDRSVR